MTRTSTDARRRLHSLALLTAWLLARPHSLQAQLVSQGTFQVLRKRDGSEICRAAWEVHDSPLELGCTADC